LLKGARDQPGYAQAKAKYLPHRPPGTSIAGVQIRKSENAGRH